MQGGHKYRTVLQKFVIPACDDEEIHPVQFSFIIWSKKGRKVCCITTFTYYTTLDKKLNKTDICIAFLRHHIQEL